MEIVSKVYIFRDCFSANQYMMKENFVQINFFFKGDLHIWRYDDYVRVLVWWNFPWKPSTCRKPVKTRWGFKNYKKSANVGVTCFQSFKVCLFHILQLLFSLTLKFQNIPYSIFHIFLKKTWHMIFTGFQHLTCFHMIYCLLVYASFEVHLEPTDCQK